MASEKGDNSDWASSPAFGLDELLSTQLPSVDSELPMQDLHDNEPTDFLDFAGQIDTDDSNDARESIIGGITRQGDEDADWTDSDRIRALLNDSNASENIAAPSPDKPGLSLTSTNVPIKLEGRDSKEIFNSFFPGEMIEISDDDGDTSKAIAKNKYKYGITLPDGIIELSDSEEAPEEIIVYDDGSSSVVIKKENPDVEFLGANRNLVDLPEESSSSDDEPVLPREGPKPATDRPRINMEMIARLQRAHLAKARSQGATTGAGGIFRAPLPTSSTNDDAFAWMSEAVVQEDEPAAKFQILKESYKAKRKARKNTLEDDVEYKKAQNKENNRVKRLAQEAADSESSDEAHESDEDGLFVPQGALAPFAKRPFSTMSGDSDDDGEVAPPEKPLLQKRTTSKSKAVAAELSTKRSRAKALSKELRINMLAGIETILLRDQKREEMRGVAKVESEQGIKGGRQKRTAKASESFGAKRTKTGRMNNVGSLMTSNLYEDSNANLDRQALPTITEKKKKEFMATLIASVPLEDQKQAKQDKVDIVRASKILALRNVVPDGKGNWSFKGMRSSLYHYQVTGAACMKLREIGQQHPYGGILADEMGLGKTVQMIATMISHRQMDPEQSKCTLIVCSPALMRQWELELELHADPKIFGRVLRHHAGNKVQGKGAEGDLKKADIVLTTYGEVVRSYPTCNIPKDLKTPAQKEAWWATEWEEKRDLLHRVVFYRVVLDEAQVIKNHTSQTSIACRALMAKHRWAISGTPIQNRLDELFPYFKFLRVKHTGSISIFRHNFCSKDSDVCNKRLHSFLEGLMIRRTHQDTLLGAPLMKLPKNTQDSIYLKMNRVEEQLYQAIRLRCIRAINTVARNPDFEENTTIKTAIIYFQRLRQMVGHCFMVQELLEKEFTVTDIDSIQKNIFSESTTDEDPERRLLQGLKRMIQDKFDSKDLPGTEMSFSTPEDETAALKVTKKKKTSELISSFKKFLKDLKKYSKWEELRERTMCQTCGEQPDDPYVTSCLHLYCKECLNELAYRSSEQDLDETPCGKCGTIFSESQQCEALKELEVKDLSASVFQQDEDKSPVKKPFKLTMNYVDGKDGLVLSSKTAAVKEQLKKWLTEDPDRKIIVFTEWLMVMHVLGKVCQKEGWKCTHYNGRMSHKARDQSLDAFRSPTLGYKVLIASLKCGGTGLNLTIASKVICVDLWFNRCVEQQAFARVHRIGQTEETYITRCVMKDTVDERLIAMQQEKHEIISAAIDDKSVMAQLTLPELLKLFGQVVYDSNSKPFILVDDEQGICPKKPAQPEVVEE